MCVSPFRRHLTRLPPENSFAGPNHGRPGHFADGRLRNGMIFWLHYYRAVGLKGYVARAGLAEAMVDVLEELTRRVRTLRVEVGGLGDEPAARRYACGRAGARAAGGSAAGAASGVLIGHRLEN